MKNKFNRGDLIMVVDGMKQKNWGVCVGSGVGPAYGHLKKGFVEHWADIVWTDEPGKVYKIWSASTYYKKIEVIERV
jgi:hypothetical protein